MAVLDPLIPHTWQERDIDNLLFWDCTGLVAVQTGGGKAQPLDSSALTPSGFIRMGDVQVGQIVLTPSGEKTRVSGVYPQGQRPVYKIVFGDGREVLADEDHLWSVHNRTDAHTGRADRTLTTKQIAETCTVENDGSSRWFVSVISAPELGDGWKSTIDPYILGLILGDGGLTTGMVYYSGMDVELLDAIRAWLPEGHKLRKASGDCDYRISTGRESGKAGRNLVLNELRRLNLMGKGSGEKFIPEELKHSPVADRHALLQGLFDTDGSMKHSGGVEYSTKSPSLRDDVVWLVQSLGGKAIPKSIFVNGTEYFRIFVRLPNDFPPFRLARKANRAPVATKYELKHLPIRSVEYVGMMETQCIAVEHESHEYVTDGFVRTHNTTVAVEAVLRSGHHTRGAVLVIAPKSTFKKTWVQTFERQGGITPRQVNSTKDGKQAEIALRFNEPGVYLINHELFTRRDWAGVEVELCIADEAHKMSNYQMLTEKKVNSGAWKLTHFIAKRRIAMSATPYRNNFSNIWTLLRWLYPDQNAQGQIADRSFWRWTESWCVVENNYFAGKVVKGELVPGKLVSQIPCYIYHAKRQPCCEFHPEGFLATDEPERIVRTVELSPAMKKAYKHLEEDYVAFLGENPLVVELPIVMRARLRQMSLGMIQVDENDNVTYAVDCESPKYEDLKDVLEQEIPGEPVLVVTHSKQFALVLAEKLRRDKYTVAEWHGDLKQSERDAEGERFEAGEAQVLVATIASLGTGTDFLQRVTQTIVWMSRTDDSVENFQMEGRLDRVGSLGRVVSIEIQAEDTYDSGVMSKDLQKALEMNRTLKLQ